MTDNQKGVLNSSDLNFGTPDISRFTHVSSQFIQVIIEKSLSYRLIFEKIVMLQMYTFVSLSAQYAIALGFRKRGFYLTRRLSRLANDRIENERFRIKYHSNKYGSVQYRLNEQVKNAECPI